VARWGPVLLAKVKQGLVYWERQNGKKCSLWEE
jgi:hypothetical protein